MASRLLYLFESVVSVLIPALSKAQASLLDHDQVLRTRLAVDLLE
jgi:hypothetical protein